MKTTSSALRLGVCLAGTALLLATALRRDASADEADQKVRAQTLFLEGRKAIDAGDHVAGCAKVRESLALFTVANSLFTVAQCDEREGRIASAIEHWERGLALVDAGDARAKVAKDRIAALEPRVPRIRVVVPPSSVSAVVVMDDVELSPVVLAAPLRVNPGKHVFVVRATGRQDVRREIDIAEKERTEFVATIGAAPGQTTPVASTSASPPPPASAGPPPPPLPGNPRRTAGLVVGSLGVMGLIGGAVTGVMLNSSNDEIRRLDDECTGDPCDMSARNDTVRRFNGLLTGNTIAFGIGIAGVGAGLVLLLTAPANGPSKSEKTSVVPIAFPGGGGIGLSGRF